MTPTAKGAAIALPAVTAISPEWGLALGLGLLGGWFARAGLSIEGKMPWTDIKRQLLVSVMISGGSILTTLVIAQMTQADELGVATIGFAVAFAGTDALRMLRDYILAPILQAIRSAKP